MPDDEVQNLKNELGKKMKEYGSVELMANLALKETYDQSSMFHNPANPMGENPFVAFSLGLFLSNNNLKAGEPHPNQLNEFVALLTAYFDTFKISLMKVDVENHKSEDSILFTSQLQKIVDDLNPHMFPNQKDDYLQKVFVPLNEHFVSRYGFSIDNARNFVDIFVDRLGAHMKDRYKLACEKYHEAKEQLTKPESAPLLKKYEENNITPEQYLQFYANTLRLWGSKNILVINVDEYCKEQNIENKDAFRRYLDTFSCTFGEQIKEFEDPLSDNIIFYKPIIKLDDNTFFLPKPDFLHDKLDSLLEFLLEEEKQTHSTIWNQFIELKSNFLETKSIEFFSRVFPEKCLFPNACYWIGRDRMEVDLLIVYDNKIIIIESKSGKLPLSAKRDGQEKLQKRLIDLIQKALLQATGARDYIKSQPLVQFWNKSKDKILVEINSSDTAYEFFFIGVTLEHLGLIGTSLKNIDAFNFFQAGEYPWSVYLHDLDVVTDLLDEPIYFIHYLEQRMIAQTENIFSSPLELSLLGYYLTHGTFHTRVLTDSENVGIISLMPALMDPIENYYLLDKEKPKLAIPKNLEELLMNMQKYHQKGFTKISSLLLDFPLHYKKMMEKKLARVFEQTSKNRVPNGFTLAIGKPFEIGFSYFTSFGMQNFYKYVVKQYKTRKQEHKITRWATIGRNVLDKKNYATFFIYDDDAV
jgi:hypothetical protein